MKDTHRGQCACGHITYTVTGRPTWTAGCCCRDCARATGTPYVVWVGFPPPSVRFPAHEPEIAETSRGVLRGFCPSCGSSLTYGRDAKFDVENPLLYVAAATLDDSAAFPPTEVVWYSQRPSWFSLADTVPLHETVSPDQSDRAYNAARDRTGQPRS